jgi:hypothetical protein
VGLKKRILKLDRTLAVKYTNGTLRGYNTVLAGVEYQQAMKRFGPEGKINNNNPTPTPTPEPIEQSTETLDKAVVDTLVNEISRLIQSSPHHPNIPIENLEVSIPSFLSRRAYVQVEDALRKLHVVPRESFMYSDYMAISAYESGMCRYGSSTPANHCGQTGYPPKAILVFEYSNSCLSVSLYPAIIGFILDRVDFFWDRTLGGTKHHDNATDSEIY